ncbi:MAG TPA: hypothetical protein VK196_08050 [Magnetospirillum sp.]|nr:hypothetical protein [Magnetospirillum sp.]
MMRACALTAALLLACHLAPAPATAQPADALDFVPPEIPGDAETARADWREALRVSVENATSLDRYRHNLVVPVPANSPNSPDTANRTSLDVRGGWNLGREIRASVSDRLNLSFQNDADTVSSRTLRNDLREAFVTWAPTPGTYVDMGRINVRNGVAMGFNPVDFLRAHTLVDQASQDPSVLRENRLGTVMARVQWVGETGAASILLAPRLAPETPIDDQQHPAFNPEWGRTNGTTRMLLSASLNQADDLSPQVLLYHDESETRLGATLSHAVGEATVVYGEWAGGRGTNVSARARAYGARTGSLDRLGALAGLSQPDDGKSFYQDAVVGGSWTSTAKVTLNLEYIYHGAGLSRAEWHDWWKVGSLATQSLPVNELQWYDRAYAKSEQVPFTRHHAFARVAWTDAFIPRLELSAFSLVNLYDGSLMGQVSATYYWSDQWTTEILAGGTLGRDTSVYGSQSRTTNASFRLVRYF